MQAEDGKLTEQVGRPWAVSPCSELPKVPCPSLPAWCPFPASSLMAGLGRGHVPLTWAQSAPWGQHLSGLKHPQMSRAAFVLTLPAQFLAVWLKADPSIPGAGLSLAGDNLPLEAACPAQNHHQKVFGHPIFAHPDLPWVFKSLSAKKAALGHGKDTGTFCAAWLHPRAVHTDSATWGMDTAPGKATLPGKMLPRRNLRTNVLQRAATEQENKI